MQSDRDLNYYFVGKGNAISLNPESADLIRNMVHMDHLVGTLLKEKFGNTGQSQPYMASDWSTSEDRLTWDFYLKPGLKCEDGTPIDAPAFVKSFNRTLKLFANDLAGFNRLKGWGKFKSSDVPLEGIQSKSSSHLQFFFDSPPDGFAEFLTMPFYGFYCEANFENGKWRNQKHIVSSGPYRLEPDSVTDDRVVLLRRNDFPLVAAAAPERIIMQSIEASDAARLKNKKTILYYRQNENAPAPEGYSIFQGAPIFLTALVLSPHRKTVFDRIENRRAFREAIQKSMKEVTPPGTGASKLFPGGRFYISGQANHSEPIEGAKSVNFVPSEPLKILRFGIRSPLGLYTQEIVIRALKQLNWPYEMIDGDYKNPDFLKKRNTNTEFDIRLANVDIGGNAENWVINMMFCSQLAISFPDASGKICQLVKEHEGRGGKYDTGEYLAQFEKIVADDSAVLPLFHTGSYWLASPDIDLEKILEPSLVVPRLDQLRFK
jgi:ABC-type transport system substrate-binding protein